MTSQQRRRLVTGSIFIVLGVVFLLEALDIYRISPSTLWPILLIALGATVLAGTGNDGGADTAA